MSKKIEIYENTLLKLLVRRGIDADRKNVVLSEGELGYTTDLKRLYVGDGRTPGGILIGGNTVFPPTNDITSIANVTEGDVVYSPSEGKLYRFLGGENNSTTKWQAIGGVVKNSDDTIVISQDNKIAVGQISASNIDMSSVFGSGLEVDSVTGKIRLSKNIFADTINVATPGNILELPGTLKINDLPYTLPSGERQTDSYLATDSVGNLTWKRLESTANIVVTNPSGIVPVGSIVPFVSSTNIPAGWLLCDGQSVSKTTFSELYDTIGDTYGSTVNTFKIPNLLNRSLYGVQSDPGSSTVQNLDTSGTGTLSAVGALFLIKATPDTTAETTITVISPLSCAVDGVDKTGEPITLFDGDIVIGSTPETTLEGSTGYRNKAINGNFDIWQRRTSTLNIPISGPSYPSAQTADRWGCYGRGKGNGTYSVSRQTCTNNELTFFNANYFQRLTYKNGVGGDKVVTLYSFIGPDTDINIIGDTSGSMPQAVVTLQHAVTGGALKALLLPYYNNDTVLYDQRVQFFQSGTHATGAERTFATNMLNRPGRGGARLINMVFQDESGTQPESYQHTNNANYIADMTALRTTLDATTPGNFIGLVFHVDSAATDEPAFKTFLQQIKAGTGVFTSLNLKDKPEVNFFYDTTNSTDQQYFVDLIISKLLSFTDFITSNLTPSYNDINNYYSSSLAIQNIENAAEVLGKTMTLSFWARASQPTKIFSETQIHSSVGKLWTPTIHKIFNLTTSWQKFTHTYTLPTYNQVISVAYDDTAVVTSNPTYTPLGANIPPLSAWVHQIDIKTHWSKAAAIKHGNAWNGSTSLRPGAAVNYPGEAMTQAELIAINTSVLSGAEGWYDIAQIQLEEGSRPTPFEFRPAGIELGLCQRYYEIGGTLTPDPQGSRSRHHLCTVNGNTHAGWQFATAKAKSPTVSFWRPSLGKEASIGYIENYGETNEIAVTNITANPYGVTYFNTVGNINPLIHTNGLMEIGWDASAEI